MLITQPAAPAAPRYRSLGDGLRADVGRAVAMATGGALAFAPIEYAITLWTYVGPVALGSKLRLAALTATLALLLWLKLAGALASIGTARRLYRARIDPAAGTAPGLFQPAPLAGGIRPSVPAVWAAVAAGLGFVIAVQRLGVWAGASYKEPQLTAGLVAAGALGAAVVARALFAALRLAAAAGARELAPLGAWNPLGRWRAAGVAFAGLVFAGLAVCWLLLPQSRSVLPVRLAISAVVVALGMGLGARRAALPARGPRRARAARRRDAALLAAGALVVVPATLVRWGADLETKYVAITASPALDRLIALVRIANDLDRDGFGSLLGEADCAPLTAGIHPGAIDLPSDGIDQNCDGRDFSLADLAAPPGPAPPVPDAFKRDWSFLFITIDTVRYDRTSFGGYRDGPRRRDTTPRLAELVSRSTSFAFAQAPSAGTMASIPAIVTSRFFHSGIAIDENMPRGTPPKIMAENTTLPEVMKRAGYATGVIGSHEWWNNWGLEQGVDDYDNSIGKTADPFRVAADKVTDHALAWISRHQGRKWFLWAHYIDPHGRYVAHPDVVDYGTAEPDLYDAELRWTDRELGRLFDELRRLPSYGNTIIVITSDHGDSMGEHTVPVGTHGTALYRELLHVPLIFYIPDGKPRVIRGAVTPLDVMPTIAGIAGIPIDDLSLEGRSLVGALFYGKEDRERVVFAETNAPGKQRAAISEQWKLIYYLNSNLYELFDLAADPWEKTNLAPKRPPGMEPMQRALSAWMDRVLYARDPLFNQAFRRVAELILGEPPVPEVPAAGQHLAGGKLQLLGIGRDPATPIAPGAKVDVFVYFRVAEPVAESYRFQLVAWPSAPGAPLDAPIAPAAMRSADRVTADGAYPTARWRKGEFIRERFTLVLPPEWRGEALAVALLATDVASGQRARPPGAAPANDPMAFALGALSARGPASVPPPPPP
ncbi:MAG TPA: sulfatase-like hydrolase/transferase [Kofleriaceae bacterium]|nr:sulfatase-like hydrolase/transferase [Kofleriaceae bacterium]